MPMVALLSTDGFMNEMRFERIQVVSQWHFYSQTLFLTALIEFANNLIPFYRMKDKILELGHRSSEQSLYVLKQSLFRTRP